MGGGGLNTNYFERSGSELLQFVFYICSYPGIWSGLALDPGGGLDTASEKCLDIYLFM